MAPTVQPQALGDPFLISVKRLERRAIAIFFLLLKLIGIATLLLIDGGLLWEVWDMERRMHSASPMSQYWYDETWNVPRREGGMIRRPAPSARHFECIGLNSRTRMEPCGMGQKATRNHIATTSPAPGTTPCYMPAVRKPGRRSAEVRPSAATFADCAPTASIHKLRRRTVTR